jgi:hypothetical protein
LLLFFVWSTDDIADYEFELIEARLNNQGRSAAALQLFSLMGSRTDDWPLGFFQALQQEAPEFIEKIVPYGVNPSM